MAPLLATVNTSVWLGTPYCGERGQFAPPGGAGRPMAIGPSPAPPPWTQDTRRPRCWPR